MASTVFQDFQLPAVNAAWLNDVNGVTYGILGGAYTPTFASVGVAGPVRQGQSSAGGLIPTITEYSYYSAKSIVDHAYYDFIANSVVTYSGGAPLYGHASFNDNITFNGSVASDHHHSYQSYPHYNTAATIGVLSSFWSQIDTTAGTVSQASGVKINNPLGTGTITTLFGLYVDNLTRATVSTNNWGLFSRTRQNFVGGELHFGDVAGTAYTRIEYSLSLGHLCLVPRGGYGVKIVGSAGDRKLRFGVGTSDADDATIESAATGDFEIKARAGGAYSVAMLSPMKLPVYTYAVLTAAFPAASVPYARAFVSDATATTYYSVVAGGGTNKVPVWSDGTDWRIG